MRDPEQEDYEDGESVSLEIMDEDEGESMDAPPPPPVTSGGIIDPAQAETQLQLQTPSPASKAALDKSDDTPELDEKIARLEPLALTYIYIYAAMHRHCVGFA